MLSRCLAVEAPRGQRLSNLIALDASHAAVSVAVLCHGGEGAPIAREAFASRSGEHAEQLMAMIAAVMRESGVAFAALDRIAVTVGPGSFTGVRVGIAAARGLGLAAGRPVVGASSLAVMAAEAVRLLPPRADGLLAVAVDAGRGMVFFQLFRSPQDPQSSPLYLPPAAAAGLVGGRRVRLVGSAAAAVAAALAAGGGTAEVARTRLQPRARSLLALTLAGAASGPVRPLYLRPHGAVPPANGALASGR